MKSSTQGVSCSITESDRDAEFQSVVHRRTLSLFNVEQQLSSLSPCCMGVKNQLESLLEASVISPLIALLLPDSGDPLKCSAAQAREKSINFLGVRGQQFGRDRFFPGWRSLRRALFEVLHSVRSRQVGAEEKYRRTGRWDYEWALIDNLKVKLFGK